MGDCSMILTRRPGATVSVFESNRNAEVYAYYIITRGNRPMPSRADIDPAKFKKHLPYVYMAKVVREDDDDHRFQISLMGTELVEVLKQDGKGRFIRELDLGGYEHAWRESILSAFKSKSPAVTMDRILMKSGLEINLEHLVLPLSDDGEHVDRIFGCFDFPHYTDEWISENLDQVDWANAVQIEVPKRLLITNLELPLD